MDVFVAGRAVFDIDSAAEHIAGYVRRRPTTVEVYDLGGPAPSDTVDAVTVGDLGRLTLINAKLTGDDAAFFLRDVDMTGLLGGLTIDLRLPDLDVAASGEDAPYQRMCRAYTALTDRRGIRRAKATKLLHLKRPHLFPILDSRIVEVYRDAAAEQARYLGAAFPQFWPAIIDDARLNAGAFEDLRASRLRAAGVGALAHLSDLRLQDILAWRP